MFDKMLVQHLFLNMDSHFIERKLEVEGGSMVDAPKGLMTHDFTHMWNFVLLLLLAIGIWA